MSDPDLIDVRFLRLFEALYTSGSVTRAADKLGLTQPTVSIGLGKLRNHFADPLFVRTGDGMRPTPKADALIGPVVATLKSLREISQWESRFEPSTAARRFCISMTDASHITLLPLLLADLRHLAPKIALEAIRIDRQTPQALQSGEADLALGLIPGLDAGFYQQTLYHQDWVCIVNSGHPRVRGPLTISDYREEAHIAIVSGTGQDLLDTALASQGLERRVLLRLPGFLGLAGILSTSDLVATLPRHIGTTLAKLARLAVHDCPFPIPTFPVKQHWHARYHHDPANAWLRATCARIFTRLAPDSGVLPVSAVQRD